MGLSQQSEYHQTGESSFESCLRDSSTKGFKVDFVGTWEKILLL